MRARSIPLAIIAATSLALVGCASGGGGASPSSDEACPDGVTEIKALVAPGQAGAEITLGNTLGYFEAACLDVSLQTAKSPAASLAAVMGGSAQLTFTPVNVLINAIDQGLDIKALAPDSSVPPNARDIPYEQVTSSDFYVPKGSTITKASDLEGKVVTVAARGDSSEVRLTAAMVNAGADPSKVKWTPLDFPTALQQLIDGKVDASALVGQFATKAQLAGATIPVQTIMDLYAPGSPYTMWTTSGAFYEKNPEAVKALGATLMKIQQYALKNTDDWNQAQSDYSKVPLDVVEKDKEVTWWPESQDEEDLTRVAKIMVELGFLEKMPELGDVIVK